MTTNVTKISLLVLIGLPGSGKTSFSKYLTECIENSLCSPDITLPCYVITVCYDKIVLSSFRKEGQDNASWSETRKNIEKNVENIIAGLKSCSDPVGLAKQHNLSICHRKEQYKSNSRILIVIDDNMYYRSMRYQYYQMARTHNLGFCQVFLKCDTEECLKRNAARNAQEMVSEEIILRMAQNIEEPNAQAHAWEKFSCTVPSADPFTPSTFASLCSTINLAFTNPVAPHPSSDGQLSREICSSSVAHQADLALRKAIGVRIKEQRGRLSPKQISHLCSELNAKKQTLLQSIKSGELVLPSEVCSAVEEGNPSHLFTFLSQLLVE